jgi:hypothetical protein
MDLPNEFLNPFIVISKPSDFIFPRHCNI